MFLKTILSGLLLAGVVSGASSQENAGIEFFHGSWEEVQKKAKEENKYIFVDCFTTWCGPCKMMSKNIFPLEEVGEFYNEHFINYKLDMEAEGDGVTFAKTYGVSAFPTYMFFTPEGEKVHRAVGSKPADRFIEDGKNAMDPEKQFFTVEARLEKSDKPIDWLNLAQLYQSNGVGIRNDLIKKYTEATTSKEWSDQEHWDLLIQVSLDLESPIYQHIVNHLNDYRSMSDEKRFEYFIDQPWNMLVSRCVYREKPTFEEAKSTLTEYLPKEMRREALAYLEYSYAAKNQPEQHFEKLTTYVDGFVDDAEDLNGFAWEIVENEFSDPKQIAKGLKWVEKSISMEKNYNNLDTKAWLLYMAGDYDAAKKTAEEAITQAEEEGADHEGTDELLEMLSEH